MDESSSFSEFDRLMARLVEGDASPQDIAKLEEYLDGKPDAQRRYVHYIDLHQELHHWARRELKSQFEAAHASGLTNATKHSSGSQSHFATYVAIATSLSLLVTLGLGIGLWMHSTSGDEQTAITYSEDSDSVATVEKFDDGVAVLASALDAEWSSLAPPEPGSILSPGELKLISGLIRLEFYNGVQLLVEGPADLDIHSVSKVICREGRLRSLVPPNATGFSVLTPQFELVDLGTEFGVTVDSDGRADAHVFDGKVELYAADGKREASSKQTLFGGNAILWSTKGERIRQEALPETFASFDAIRDQEQSASRERYERWRKLNDTLRTDPRVIARYDFQGEGPTLKDVSKSEAHGTIIGCEWASGRWAGKQALEFKRPGDRVRINVPGTFDALTIAAWVRIDALPERFQSLLLTDGYKVGHLHWQVGFPGDLRIDCREPPNVDRNTRYVSPPLFGPRQLGVWSFVCSTYDRRAKTVTHWLNGKRVFATSIEVDQPIRIGSAEIGNWGIPDEHALRPIRNFVGHMDELTIWNAALLADEIAYLYNTSRP
ncbi:LamG-like jellyroll fold domain-containing protein [Bremerella sp. JC770]|uniref:LamG-like jellyroll fold domain-containing protein n=1 Tax=Bremerella sp. JC770 TaxID=3232137 RepID=UPI003459840E